MKIAAVYAAVGAAPSASNDLVSRSELYAAVIAARSEGEKAGVAQERSRIAAEEQEEPAAPVFVRSNDVDAFSSYYRTQNTQTSEQRNTAELWDAALVARRADRDAFTY